jgi:hypothetical protein
MPSIVPWHQIIHLTVNDTLKLTQLRSILSHVSRLHTLKLNQSVGHINKLNADKRFLLIDLLEDISTCNMLISNGLRKLSFGILSDMSNIIDIARLIVERLSQLQIMRIHCSEDDMPTFVHTLINGLPNLTFLVANCGSMNGTWTELKLRALQTSDTRAFQTQIHDSLHHNFISIWL